MHMYAEARRERRGVESLSGAGNSVGKSHWKFIGKCHWKSTMIFEVLISGVRSFAHTCLGVRSNVCSARTQSQGPLFVEVPLPDSGGDRARDAVTGLRIISEIISCQQKIPVLGPLWSRSPLPNSGGDRARLGLPLAGQDEATLGHLASNNNNNNNNNKCYHLLVVVSLSF